MEQLIGPGIYGPPLPDRQQSQLDWRPPVAERAFPQNPIIVPRDGFPHDISLALDEGTRALDFLFLQPSAIAQLQVVGAESGIDYASRSPAGVDQHVTIRVLPSVDPSVKVTITTNLGSGTTPVLLAFLFRDVVFVPDSSEQPSGVVIMDNLGGLIGTENTTVNGPRENLAVSLRYSTPAPYQAPLLTLIFDVLLNNSSVNIVNAVAGQRIWVHSHSCAFSAIAAATVLLEQDDTAKQFAIWNNVGTVGPFPGDSKGVPTDAGKALRLRNPFAVATTARGYVTYRQEA